MRRLATRAAGLARLAHGLPRVVQLAAAVATLAIVGISIATFVGGVISGDGFGDNEPVVRASAGPAYYSDASGGLVVDASEGDEDTLTPVGIARNGTGDDGHNIATDFTVSNPSAHATIIVIATSLLLDEFSPEPDGLQVGCVEIPQAHGLLPDNIRFSVHVNHDLVGTEQSTSGAPPPGKTIEIGPMDLQHFSGVVSFTAAGTYRYRVLARYDTSGGDSGTATSDSMEAIVIASREEAQLVGLNCD